MSLLDVRDLRVQLPTEDGVVHAVQGVSFSIEHGQFFGVAGESGSGKSVLMQAVMGLLPPSARITGEVVFKGRDLLTLQPEEWLEVRGNEICMIFQDPLSSLHPHYRVGAQITEQIFAHEQVSKQAARARAVEMLGKVGIPNPDARFSAYPHQFSGGMRQRVMIAMALVANPTLIIADEPTTALDSTVQAQILDLMQELRRDFDTTIVMITHDLSVISRVSDSVMIMYAGTMLEKGPTDVVFSAGAHPYTRGLMRSTPANYEPGTRLIPISGQTPSLLHPSIGCVFAPRCPDAMDVCRREMPPVRRYLDGGEAACWLTHEPRVLVPGVLPDVPTRSDDATPVISLRDVNLSFRTGSFSQREALHVLKGVDLDVQAGETIGLVGESGCGKSTLARVIAGLIEVESGTVTVAGHQLDAIDNQTWREMRKEVQLVFQDPYGALNPRRRIGSIIGDPLRIHGIGTSEQRKARVRELMEIVGLNPEHYNRFPAEFSGGQRQRIGIARALALNPAIVIYDEPVSALDVSIQAQILNLMADVQAEFGMTYLFISHDLAVVRHVCDRIAVMDQGRLVELAPTEQIYSDPQHEFTKRLLAAAAHAPAEDSGTEVTRQLVADDASQAPRRPDAGFPETARKPEAAVVLPVDSAPGTDDVAEASTATAVLQRGSWALTWRRLRQDRAALASAVFIVVLTIFALAAPLFESLTGHGVNEQFRETGLSAAGIPSGPSREFWLGADQLGRDVLVRLAYGARVSLLVGVLASLAAAVVGISVGLTAGYFGERVDTILSRVMDLVMSVPFLLSAIALVSVFGPSLKLSIMVIVFFSWTPIGRVIRGQTLALREREFVEAARSLGANHLSIMVREILPNLTVPIIIYVTLMIPNSIVFEATLSFLGMGIVPPAPSWGGMLSEAAGNSIYLIAWWLVLFPGLALLFTTMAFNIVGDGLRDALDPRARRKG